jgi:hypothetical protein
MPDAIAFAIERTVIAVHLLVGRASVPVTAFCR